MSFFSRIGARCRVTSYHAHAPTHMSDAELAKYKALMEEEFRKHQLKPGDEGYEYDKQVQC